MPFDLKKFFDEDGNERLPFNWELKEQGFSDDQIEEILLPFNTSKTPNLLLFITSIIGFLLTACLLIAYGVGLSYHPNPTAKHYIALCLVPIIIFLPVILLFLSKYFSKTARTTTLIIATLIGLSWIAYWLKWQLSGFGDAWLYLPGLLYGGFILATAILTLLGH